MPEKQELEYSTARDNIDLIIKNSSEKVQKHIRTIADYRSQIILGIMTDWVNMYSSSIRSFEKFFNSSSIQEDIAAAYTQYLQYTFIYRFLNGLNNNILFHKIISFELYFFSKMEVFKLTYPVGFVEPENTTDDENFNNKLLEGTFPAE